ncbi:carbohydrate-binding family 9-like protein [Pseudenhygromyxa sp. WMMC2535]|uniref:carbohydrate-binding family 9-like protein n=1 Tax=Pseudenhygromyxa sp. WMMC2535 TaxID=2712867 RepID=UPI0015957DD0|nr:carbohydrate-binding family 9-like protein [Pseudenhygromyxa sp. WMMC2535]NVB41314.1 carbohydrate-binding family 9-like protein [Pseudenhygromyxa sp. WMMC2535]
MVRRKGLEHSGRRHAGLALFCAALSCGEGEAAPADRRAVVERPLDAGDGAAQGSEGAVGSGVQAFSGTLRFTLGALRGVSVEPAALVPTRVDGEAPSPVHLRFETEGLAGAEGRLGLLPPRGAAEQGVAFGEPGQGEDPRARWIDVTIDVDGEQRFELPPPGPEWHAPWAVIVLELRMGHRHLRVRSGPRSEMLSDGTRHIGGRAVLALVPVERQPTAVEAARVEPGTITLDGELDEAVWRMRPPARLLSSLDGEPDEALEAGLGGPTQVWFAWDEAQLYVAASLPDPDLYAPHRERDDPLYREEAFEVFWAADDSARRYLEHQVSARGVHFDARFPRYREGDEGWDGSWRSALSLDGALDPRGGDRGWRVELAFPWSELCAHTKISCPPKPGQVLRGNVFRLEKPDREAQHGLALSPTLAPDFHAWQNAARIILSDTPTDP